MQDIEGLIEASTPSEVYRPERICAQDINGPAQYSLMLMEHALQGNNGNLPPRIRRAGSAIQIKDGRVYLLPVTPIARLARYKSSIRGLLTHCGILTSRKGNNAMNLLELGVWGDPSRRDPTYLQRLNASTTTYCEADTWLWVDSRILMERRTVFADPESFTECILLGDKMWDSYFVLGGIPKEAIVGARCKR